jgi:hypothetical protein
MYQYNKISFSSLDGFEWDKGNVNKNRLKHNVDTSECEEVFFNNLRIIFEDTKHTNRLEKRYRVLGISTNGRKLALAITIRNNKIRVIMARDQSRKERALFESEFKDK